MADIDITCPECGNKRSVPDDLAGKKIKCRQCQSIFTVKPPPPKAKAITAKPPAKKTAAQLKKEDDEEVADGKNPYGVQDENLAARCPFCAQLMDPPDAMICLHCGYDMQKRRRVERKITYEITAVDYLLHHIPTFLCFNAIGIIVGFVIFCVINMDDWIVGTFADGVCPASCFQTWCVLFGAYPVWLCGRFIFRRLVWYFHPPEQEKKLTED